MSATLPTDEYWMNYARKLAAEAQILGEVPVGAVIVKDGELVGEGFNRPITDNDPTAHAEVMALRDAAEKLNNYRLINCTLYVTLEPCTMCVGALVHARIARLVYGASEPKAGVIQSQAKLHESAYFNHQMQVTGGVAEQECQLQLTGFFKMRRAAHKAAKIEGKKT